MLIFMFDANVGVFKVKCKVCDHRLLEFLLQILAATPTSRRSMMTHVLLHRCMAGNCLGLRYFYTLL